MPTGSGAGRLPRCTMPTSTSTGSRRGITARWMTFAGCDRVLPQPHSQQLLTASQPEGRADSRWPASLACGVWRACGVCDGDTRPHQSCGVRPGARAGEGRSPLPARGRAGDQGRGARASQPAHSPLPHPYDAITPAGEATIATEKLRAVMELIEPSDSWPARRCARWTRSIGPRRTMGWGIGLRDRAAAEARVARRDAGGDARQREHGPSPAGGDRDARPRAGQGEAPRAERGAGADSAAPQERGARPPRAALRGWPL